MSRGDVHLEDLLKRLDQQSNAVYGLAREVSTLDANLKTISHDLDALTKSSVEYQNEMRTTVHEKFNYFAGVTSRTEASCDEMRAMVKEATEAAHLAATSKSKTEKAFDRAMLAAGTSVLFIVTAFGAPWLASKEDFWDTVWLAVKGALKVKAGA